jgi:hypothetical protein
MNLQQEQIQVKHSLIIYLMELKDLSKKVIEIKPNKPELIDYLSMILIHLMQMVKNLSQKQ